MKADGQKNAAWSDMDDSFEKPLLRGHVHQATFFFGLGACVMLIAQAPSSLSRFSAAIYTTCLALLFGISALYHRIDWPEKFRKWIQKLDHSAIFIFIAGTGTPISLLGLRGSSGQTLLTLFWTSAIVGILKEFFWKKAPRWSSGLFYVVMGWLAAPYVGEFYQILGASGTWLLVLGGIIYTIGAVVYALRWPNPYPKVFGFHEIFHVLVVLAGVLHFFVIYRLVIEPTSSV